MRRLEEDALARLVAWGKADDAVRALILTSSRARADGSADALSDYDVVVVVPDAAVFAGGDGWTRAYGRPLVRWGDADELYGSTTYFRSVVYDDGTRVDYTIWPENVAERVAEESSPPESLDVGYRVLLDKDGRTSGWRPPTYRAHVPTRPTRSEYDALTDEFWWNARDVAKAGAARSSSPSSCSTTT